MAEERRIGVVINCAAGYIHDVVRGISAAARSRRSWAVRVAGGFVDWVGKIPAWRPEGIIANAGTKQMVETLSALGVPVVNFSGGLANPCFPTVRLDDPLIGAMAAEYLLSLNLKQFAYWSGSDATFAVRREEGFFGALGRHGIAAECLHRISLPTDIAWDERGQTLQDWLIRLPKPVGLLASQDAQAYYIADIAREADLDIPNEIALIGVDDDPLLCELANPALTSVRLPARQIGAAAVQMLADLLAGRPVPAEPIQYGPVGVVARGSTDMLAIDDADVATAVRYIRDHAAEGITTDDVLRHVPLGRRTFERKFRDLFARSPVDEIHRVQINRAKALLLDSDVPMPEVARRSGFCDAQYLARVFRKETGMPPSHYRRQHRSL